MHDYWHRQEKNKPLYEEILWAKPENKRHKKKLVIVGGNTHAFTAIASSYNQTLEAGIGSCKIVLPDKLEKVIGKSIDDVVYLASDTSGGIAKGATIAMHEYAQWGDGVYLPGELGHSNETTRFVEQFVEETKSPLILSGDALEIFYEHPEDIFDRENTILVLTLSQLQKMAPQLGVEIPITHKMGLVQIVEALHSITEDRETMVLTHHQDNLIVAMYGEVSTTSVESDENWQLQTASKAAVYLLQHPEKPFQAVTTSVLSI